MDKSIKPQGLCTRHYLSLLFISIIGTYYYIIFHGDFILLDDFDVMTRLLNEHSFSFKDIFFPSALGYYYRPMIELSFRIDYLVWLDIASGYHLTNVIMHMGNAVLVYFIALILLDKIIKDSKPAAFIAALLYGLNPLSAETVCWVSGRSELMVSLFLLSSFYLYLRFKRDGEYLQLFFSGLLLFLATITKETALAFPCIVIVFEFYFMRTFFHGKEQKSYTAIAYYLILSCGYFVFFRGTGVDTSHLPSAVNSAGSQQMHLVDSMRILLASFGFYLKKLIIPYPLNFSIYAIPLTLYSVIGCVVLALFFTKGLFLPASFRFFVAWVIITVSPAVAAAVLHIPWVPWAERYLYVPLAGFCMALGLAFGMMKQNKLAIVAFILVIGLFWATTANRAYIWADEVKLWEDTSRKSEFGTAYYFYGKSLLIRKRDSEGIEQLNKAIAKGYSYHPYLALSGLALSKGDYDGSEYWLQKAASEFPKKTEIHKYLAENYLSRVKENDDGTKYIHKAIDEYTLFVANRKDDTAVLLKIAQLYKVVNQRNSAVPFLTRYLELTPRSQQASFAANYLLEIKKGNTAQ